MNASSAQVVQAVLTTQSSFLLPPGAGQTPGDGTSFCFVSSLPDDYDQCVGVFDTQGRDFGRSMRDGKYLKHPGVRVEIRALTYNVAFDLAQQVANFFATIVNTSVLVGGVLYSIKTFIRSSDIISLGEDVMKRRSLFMFLGQVAYQDSQPQVG